MMDSQIHTISSCLCVSCGKITIDKETGVITLHDSNGRQVKGLVSIVKFLTRKSNNKDMLGRTTGDQAVVDQWLEYRVTQVDRASHEKDQHNIVKELNSYLSDKVYLTGFYPTIADVTLYLGLYNILSELTFYEKQQNVHLCRWFDQVQQLPGILENSRKIYFQKNLIYSKGSSH